MSSTDLYGFKHDDLEKARIVVERTLGISLEPHESSYYGDYYLGRLPDEQNKGVHLQHNIDPLHNPDTDPPDEHFAVPEFRDSPLLLYVTGGSIDVVRQQLEQHAVGISFLRRESSE